MNANQLQCLESGRQHGQKWAHEQATKGQLARLQKHHRNLALQPIYNWEWWFCDHFDAWTPAERLYFIIGGLDTDDCDCDAPAQFWASLPDSDDFDLMDSDFLRGFAEGAIEIGPEPGLRVQ